MLTETDDVDRRANFALRSRRRTLIDKERRVLLSLAGIFAYLAFGHCLILAGAGVPTASILMPWLFNLLLAMLYAYGAFVSWRGRPVNRVTALAAPLIYLGASLLMLAIAPFPFFLNVVAVVLFWVLHRVRLDIRALPTELAQSVN